MGATRANYVQSGTCIHQGAPSSRQLNQGPIDGQLVSGTQRRLPPSIVLWLPALVPHWSRQRTHQYAPMSAK